MNYFFIFFILGDLVKHKKPFPFEKYFGNLPSQCEYKDSNMASSIGKVGNASLTFPKDPKVYP